MNNQVGEVKATDYNSNQAIIKSQKILNSTSNFHTKTEQQDRLQQDHKSPDNRNDLRQTSWRRPKMPHNKLLPDAFNFQTKGKRDLDFNKKKQKNNKDLLENIDKKVIENQAKEVQKFLAPIHLRKRSEQKHKQIPENGNPLIAFPKFMKIKNQFNKNMKEIQEIQDMSINKFKAFSTKQSTGIKISECITLEVIKRGHNTGTLKKMLHVPTLKLLCIRQEPLSSKQSRQAIKEWVMQWQSKVLAYEDSQKFINVYSIFFNYPEGAVSIVTQYFKRGSLLNLLNVVITLPQNVIRQIFIQVIDSLTTYYELTDMHFGGLSPSQIMLTEDGKIKLGMGLYHHFLNVSSNGIYHIKTTQKTNVFDFNSTQNRFLKNSIQKPLNLQLQRSYDIFKLGLIILECAIGGFQNFQQSALVHQNIKLIFTEQGQKYIQKDNVCCVIHSQSYLLEYGSLQMIEGTKRDKIQINKVLQYIKLLKDRFSLPFINFLCICLKLSHAKRANISDLLNHSFLKNQNIKDTKTVKIDLSDLLQISSDQNQFNYFESGKQEKMDKFLGHILQILNDCRKQTISELLSNEKDKILNISKYIEVNYMNLGQKLYAAMVDIVKNDQKEYTPTL